MAKRKSNQKKELTMPTFIKKGDKIKCPYKTCDAGEGLTLRQVCYLGGNTKNKECKNKIKNVKIKKRNGK